VEKGMKTDFLIIGGGIVGLTIARELLQHGVTDIILIDKEKALGVHASGRNSGVLHAGIYYQKDTMKARFCQVGSRLMKQYCLENGLTVLKTGKVIVARDETEIDGLNALFSRAQANGARVSLVDRQVLADIEPSAFTVDKAIVSPDTAMIDPKQVLRTLQQELVRKGVKIITDCAFQGLKGENTALTKFGTIKFKKCINAAGSYADKVAHCFGVGLEYKMMPFKGVYRQLRGDSACHVNGNIYPVPNLRNPFLGVHFTRNTQGLVTIGPTAIPCFGRENYYGFRGVEREVFSIVGGAAKLLVSNPGFRQVALTEPKKYWKRYLYRDAAKLVKSLSPSDLLPCKKVGIRPQLIHWPSKQLVMDFLVKRTENSLHLLNSISPAFTCSMAVAKHVVDTHFSV
jgi:(S)-2-hydroxyglutarate dehydrogenase